MNKYLIHKEFETQKFIIPLWDKNIPNFQDVGEKEIIDNDSGHTSFKLVTNPSISVFLPSKMNLNGQAVLVIPGGGYQAVVSEWEGSDVAKWLNGSGISAFVLKYRLPNAKNNIVRHKSPLIDAMRAIRIIRNNADIWNIKNDQIGVMGFSAGGHLASTLATHFYNNKIEVVDNIDSISAQPNFMVLLYPVISMSTDFTHQGSKMNLLGHSSSKELDEFYSNEKHVTKTTPPTFLVHSSDDKVVPVENSLAFYKALQENNIPSEMHIFQQGGHGFSLANELGNTERWKSLCIAWLRSLKSK